MTLFWLLVRLRLAEILKSASSAGFMFALPLVLFGALALVFRGGHPFEVRRLAVVGDPAHLAAVARSPDVAFDLEPSFDVALAKLRTREVAAIVLANRTPLRVLVGPRERLFGRGLASALAPGTEIEDAVVPTTGYLAFLVPGLLAQGILLAGLFGMGSSMVRLRESHFLKKLATTPLPRSTFLLSQIVARGVLVLGQVALVLTAATMALDLDLTLPEVLLAFGAALLGLLVFLGLGLLLAVTIEHESLALDVIFAVAVPLVLFSEMFFSNATLPPPLPAIASLLPSTMLVQLFRAILLHGVTQLGPLAPSLVGLAVWAAGSFAIALRAFRFR